MENREVVQVDAAQILARADRVTPEEWAALQAEDIYRALYQDIIDGWCPMAADLKDCGTGVRYFTGMVLMLRERDFEKRIKFHFPFQVLHVLSREKLMLIFGPILATSHDG